MLSFSGNALRHQSLEIAYRQRSQVRKKLKHFAKMSHTKRWCIYMKCHFERQRYLLEKIKLAQAFVIQKIKCIMLQMDQELISMAWGNVFFHIIDFVFS